VERNNIPKDIKLRPLIYLPIAAQLETQGFDNTLEHCLARIHSAASINELGAVPLHISIDRWRGNFKTEILARVLKELILSTQISISILGPSTAEIAQSIEYNQRSVLDKNLNTPLLLGLIFEAGVKAIEGGSNLETHKLAAQLGFKLRVAQVIDPSVNVFQKLFEAREALIETKALETWYPIQSRFKEPNNFFRTLCFARLILPEIPFIRAPISLLGSSGAYAAACFGVNDIGYLAADAETSRALEIERIEHVHGAGYTQVGVRRVYERV
jgi:hypothetical protein